MVSYKLDIIDNIYYINSTILYGLLLSEWSMP